MKNKQLDSNRLIDLSVEAAVWTKKQYFRLEKLEDIHKQIVEISEALPELLATYKAYQKFIDGEPETKKVQVNKAA